MNLPQCPSFIGFTYLDPASGLSAKGSPRADRDFAENPVVTVHPVPFPNAVWSVVDDSERQSLDLPVVPGWVKRFGAQPTPGTLWGTWRRHSGMKGRFHPQYPDDVQVLVHDGGPRLSSHRPELVWVRIVGCEGDLFTGRVLNQPDQLTTVSAGAEIQFVAPKGGAHLLYVTPKYLAERENWTIEPCNKCGSSELLDAPSDLIPVVFPDVPGGTIMEMFTSFCGMCGGVQVVQHRSLVERQAKQTKRPRGKWWQFWR